MLILNRLGIFLGAIGTRPIGTLARVLNWENGRLGVATACVGGGQGISTIFDYNREGVENLQLGR